MPTPYAPYGCYPGTSVPRRSPPSDAPSKRGVCKYCQEGDLIWEERAGKWRLVEVGGKLHVCARTPPLEARP